jgi:hypothetical protein
MVGLIGVLYTFDDPSSEARACNLVQQASIVKPISQVPKCLPVSRSLSRLKADKHTHIATSSAETSSRNSA